MCGIFCSIIHNQNTFLNDLARGKSFKNCNPEFSECYNEFIARGPDSFKELQIDLSPYTLIQFAGSVLWTQGGKIIDQPIQDTKGNVLLWNGDIFSGNLAGVENDTQQLSFALMKATKKTEILEIFSSIRGPYSFIFFHKDEKILYFGRDPVGRHSLVMHFSPRNKMICSVSCKCVDDVLEVPAAGVFYVDLTMEEEMKLFLHPWVHLTSEHLDLKLRLLNNIEENILEPIESAILAPVRKRKEPTKEELKHWSYYPSHTSFSDLMESLDSTDFTKRFKKALAILSEKDDVQILINDLRKLLEEAVKLRVKKQPKYCQECVKSLKEPCVHTKTAILFSGGLDSAILAALAHQFIPSEEPIDLLNVAFEKINHATDKDRGRRSAENSKIDHFNVPDRETGLKTLKELEGLFPNRKWNFLKINVTHEELQKERKAVISGLIHPLNTVLDDSLGCALWFASRGKGVLNNNELYISPARIILSGIGADEQLGGYMRHRTTLKHKGGWTGLDKELALEIGRISERNLGRDDRVISYHGRQCRMPYLDESVLNFLAFLPPWQRCNPIESMPPGLGDKLLLRLVAWKLGLCNAANFPKKAMQFGSKIADSREKGVDISNRLIS